MTRGAQVRGLGPGGLSKRPISRELAARSPRVRGTPKGGTYVSCANFGDSRFSPTERVAIHALRGALRGFLWLTWLLACSLT